MNRAKRRKEVRELKKENKEIEKQIKNKLTNEQYENYKNKAIYELVIKMLDDYVREFNNHYSDVLVDVMRKNRISKERCERIIKETIQESDRRLKESLR